MHAKNMTVFCSMNIIPVVYCRSHEEKEMIWQLECVLLVFVIIYVWWTYHMPYFLLLMLTLIVWYTQPMLTANIRYSFSCIFNQLIAYAIICIYTVKVFWQRR